ncbi:RloB-like protein [Lentzea waywayandensis]|uniref:RloB-like protein n=1 Tax=Lentzea waywayandensis TaxID=84724 RepID=A0A1I6ETV8_9PSEU|nr:RloB family protein [Lentzea waywayandensis]SFR21145.1 RloB-like protein [Lentzea waywayandensis]
MSSHENSDGRRGRRAARPGRILVVSGGQRTEPDYFSGLRRLRRARVEVKHKVDSPQNLVRYAKKIFNNEEYDAVWCVVDVDQFDVDAAKKLARQKSVELAVSEPCFELWLLLHFTDHRAYIADGKAACALLTRRVPGYDKKLDFARFDAAVETAIKRAKELPPGNPSTDVWRLVEVLLQH